MPADISSTTIEFHRFGDEPGSLQKGSKYIRTCGYQKAADEVVVRIEPKGSPAQPESVEIRPQSNDRVRDGGAAAARRRKRTIFLRSRKSSRSRGAALHQIDIVTHASELRAYPFEAIYANASDAYLESPAKGMILTRRIRSEFSYAVPPWPEVPSVLFVHAQLDHDLSQDLIDEHRLALSEALAPWGNPRGSREEEAAGRARDRLGRGARAGPRARELQLYPHPRAWRQVAEEDLEERRDRMGTATGQSRRGRGIAEGDCRRAQVRSTSTLWS